MFNLDQPAYKSLREIWKMRTTPVVAWVGAGLSIEADMPSWPSLRDELVSRIEGDPALGVDPIVIPYLKTEADLWGAFEIINQKIGSAAFQSLIKEKFHKAATCKIPSSYKRIWALQPRGVVTLNIDPLAQRAANEVLGGKYFSLINNRNIASYGQTFRAGHQFLANLHGVLDEGDSWVFTKTALTNLQNLPAYKHFLSGLFSSNMVVFMGIGADDQGVIGHLKHLKSQGIDLGVHYWLTDRTDSAASAIFKELGIQIITYPPNKHREALDAFLADLQKFVPTDSVPEPIHPALGLDLKIKLPSDSELVGRKSNEIRALLNQRAGNILNSSSPSKLEDYSKFIDEYEQSVHRTWYISKHLPEDFFSYKLEDRISSDGAFGQVFVASKDSNQCAIKIIHERVRDELEMLNAFRRGVESMDILSKRDIKGTVRLIEAWELPPSLVMDYVPGNNLQNAVEAKLVTQWCQVLTIGRQICSIVLSAHRLPERVLHRDIRPPNIMLRDFYDANNDIEVVVLDFDLSWHRDAVGVSLEIRSSPNGYIAPEQCDPTRKRYTRNALVDSFGVGMTLYFCCSGIHPTPGQHRSADWPNKVVEGTRRLPDCGWRSLNTRLARLIISATDDSQSSRPDLDRMGKEISILEALANGKISGSLSSYIAEEISTRSRGMSQWRKWNEVSQRSFFEAPSGVTVEVGAGKGYSIEVIVAWEHRGDRGYSEIRKYIGTKTEKAVASLKSKGASIDSKAISFDKCRVVANFSLRDNVTHEDIDHVVTAIDEAINALRFN